MSEDAQHDREQADALPSGDTGGAVFGQRADVRDLMAEIAKADGEDRRQGFDRLKTMLQARETAEEKVLRPVARETSGAQEVEKSTESPPVVVSGPSGPVRCQPWVRTSTTPVSPETTPVRLPST